MKVAYFNDYESARSSDLVTTRAYQQPYPEFLPRQHNLNVNAPIFTSFFDLMMGKCTLNDVMNDFKRNGSDSPYNPDEITWWDEPIESIPEVFAPESELTEEQSRVLSALPDHMVFALLKRLEARGAHISSSARAYSGVECRFCKNNGERESYYRSHNLKDTTGRVRCPVLRAFVCRRCGASGDSAHTIKYCPRSTDEERLKSSAMLRSVRMASGRRRLQSASREHCEQAAMYGNVNVPVAYSQQAQAPQLADAYSAAYQSAPLDPLWAALEQKLTMHY